MVVWGCESCGDELGLQVEMGGWGWPAADVTASLLVHVIPNLQAWDLDHYVGIRAVGNPRTVLYCTVPISTAGHTLNTSVAIV